MRRRLFMIWAALRWLPLMFGQLVRINDRGPFVDDRQLDVSYLVACRLGIQGQGVSRLRIELLEVPKRP